MSTTQRLLEKLGSVVKVWRLGVNGKCWQHPEARSTDVENLFPTRV
jgi:hypothetical protein